MPSKTPAAGDAGDPNKKIRVRRHFVRADYNVLENAIFDIDNRSDSKTLAVVKTIRRGNDSIISSWIARSEKELPKAFDKKVLYVFFKLYEDQGFPADGRVHFTFFEVTKHLGLSFTGEICHRIEEAVHRLRGMTIEAGNSWFNGETKSFDQDKVQYIQMVADAYFSRPGQSGQLELEKSWVQLGAHVQANVKSGAVKMLDMETAMSIKSPIALRLFEILSKRRNKSTTHGTQLSKLAESIPMKPAAASRQLQLLKGPHDELISKGVIKDVKVTGEGKTKLLMYSFPTGESVTITEAEARRIEATGSERLAASVSIDESQPLKPDDLNFEVIGLIAGLHHLSGTWMLTQNRRTMDLVEQIGSIAKLRPIVEQIKDELTKNAQWTETEMIKTYIQRLEAEAVRTPTPDAP